MTLAQSDRARRLLCDRDPVLAGIIRRVGPCRIADRPDLPLFAFMLGSIISQQLSTRAAATIRRRVLDLFPPAEGPTAARLLQLPDDTLRGAGLSRQKVAYLRDLASKVEAGLLPVDALPHLDDEAVIAALTQVKGIGVWSAQMFLIFRLRRPDVLPTGDVGILRAVRQAYRLRKPPTADRLVRLANPWRPYRSIACWYLWASLDNAPVGETITGPTSGGAGDGRTGRAVDSGTAED